MCALLYATLKLNKGAGQKVMVMVTWARLNNLKVKNFAAAFKAFKYFNYVGFEFQLPGRSSQLPGSLLPAPSSLLSSWPKALKNCVDVSGVGAKSPGAADCQLIEKSPMPEARLVSVAKTFLLPELRVVRCELLAATRCEMRESRCDLM